MQLEEYFSASRSIHEELAQIAATTANMAAANAANADNPRFVGLMERHAYLVRQFNEMHERFAAANPIVGCRANKE